MPKDPLGAGILSIGDCIAPFAKVQQRLDLRLEFLAFGDFFARHAIRFTIFYFSTEMIWIVTVKKLAFALLWLSVFQFAFSAGIAVAQEASSTDVATDQASDAAEPENSKGEKVDAGLLSALKLRAIGPALMSGRIADIAVNSQQPNTWYVAAGSGNLWKTVNAGTTWQPIFDSYSSYSIGCVTIDPQNPNIIWVGTGEDVGGRHVGFGDGVYVSHNAGKSFRNVGLKSSEHIAKIWVHPHDSQTVLVAAQGPLWNEGGERGLYRTTDGGENWTQVLASGSWTGCTEVVSDPQDPNIIYAALHQRHRTAAVLLNTGPESGIYKSTDAGQTWTELTEGLPSEDKGKIALAVSPQKSNIVYASIELPNRTGGTWRSVDYGASWTKTSDFISGGTGPHYYQEMWADPHRFNCLYHANNSLSRSLDGGETWEGIENGRKHVDNHAIAFHPTDPDFVLCGTDGGVYCSRDFAETWVHMPNLPLTQFYKVDVDYDLPFYNIIGGTQDNSTQYGPSRTRDSSGIHNANWIIPIGGDGHDNAINPDDPNIIFCESQEGYIQRYDRKTGESILIRPAPGKGEDQYRFNWDSPILISPHDSNRLYFASNFVHRSDDHGDSWTTISPDLSRNENRLGMKVMGRVQGVDAGYDLYAMSQYGSITSLSESPVVEGLLYAGTDDGLIHVSEDGGENWRKVERIYGVPEKAFVNDIKADRHNPDVVYACLDNHKNGDFKPYLIRSQDRGKSWQSLTGDLPDRHLVWRIEQDFEVPNLLFLGTEFGLFVSLNGGENWLKMTAGIPTIPVRDLAIQKRESDLVVATFGRGFYVLDDYSPLRELAAQPLNSSQSKLFPARKTAWFQTTGVQPLDFLGNNYFAAENPPAGAVITVYVHEAYETARQQRKKKESKAAEAGQDVAIPSFEALADEAKEEQPELVIEIRDEMDNLVDRVTCPGSKGLHRVTWDMTERLPIASSPAPMVTPGNYKAQLVKLTEAGSELVSDVVTIELEAIFEPSIPAVDRDESFQFSKEVSQLLARIRKVQKESNLITDELAGRKKLIRSTAPDQGEFAEAIVGLEEQLRKLNNLLAGNQEKQSRSVLDVPTPGERLRNALYQTVGSTHGPTATSRQQVDIAAPEVQEAEELLEQIDAAIETLRDKMESAGLIWVG